MLLVEGYCLRPIVALELGLDFFVFDWASALEAFALCREAVYVSLPWNEVSFDVARCLLVALDSDHTLWAWDFIEVEPMNDPCWGVVLKCDEIRTKQHKILMLKQLLLLNN